MRPNAGMKRPSTPASFMSRKTTSGEMYFIGVGLAVSGEYGSGGARTWVPTVFAAGTHHWSKDMAFIYGAAFSMMPSDPKDPNWRLGHLTGSLGRPNFR